MRVRVRLDSKFSRSRIDFAHLFSVSLQSLAVISYRLPGAKDRHDEKLRDYELENETTGRQEQRATKAT
jgi:hypothetical protein